MKKYMISALFAIAFVTAQAQVNREVQNNIQVGDTLILQKPENGSFKHVKFPKENIIRKRGGISDMNALSGTQVVVKGVVSKNDKTIIQIQRTENLRFFSILPSVKVHLEEALESGEITTK